MSEKLAVFGASVGAKKVIRPLKDIGINVDIIVDNDKNKIGKIFEGKIIQSPQILLGKSYRIIIASVSHEEIKKQLLQMGIKKELIILREHYILKFLDNSIKESMLINQTNANIHKKENCILIDSSEGLYLGGIEKWVITLANGYIKKNKRVTLLTKKDIKNETQTLNMDVNIEYFDLSYKNYIESIKNIANYIITKLPCTIIINRIDFTFMAAYIVKKHYKNDIKIISVIHSDFERMYKQNELVNHDVTAFLCVSEDVKENFINNYNVDKSKVYYKDNPIIIEKNYHKNYSNSDQAIVIGYGGRLEKAQKRADLLIPLIQKLEEYKISYIFNIAGDGSYYNKIKEYIDKTSLQDKIKLFGKLHFDEMPDFWGKCDVFVNLSDVEGIGLSMLEAMSLGVVPVVTNTAGASSFITNGVNGYVTNLEDINAISDCINILSENRNKLSEYGLLARKVVEQKCNIDDYINYLDNHVFQGV